MTDDLPGVKGVHTFLITVEANTRADGFMCCPCVVCKNDQNYSNSRTILVHLFESSFKPYYNVWTKHGERGVMMEDNEEEEDDNNYPGHGFPKYDGTKMGEEAEPAMREEAEEEASDGPADDLGRAIAIQRETAQVKRRG